LATTPTPAARPPPSVRRGRSSRLIDNSVAAELTPDGIVEAEDIEHPPPEVPEETNEVPEAEVNADDDVDLDLNQATDTGSTSEVHGPPNDTREAVNATDNRPAEADSPDATDILTQTNEVRCDPIAVNSASQSSHVGIKQDVMTLDETGDGTGGNNAVTDQEYPNVTTGARETSDVATPEV
jgi:hypothetical protein